LGTLQGNLQLNILKDKLSDIHPVDLADILEELDSSQRALLLGGLDTEHASDTLEEIDPAVQRDIVFSLSKERVAQLIAEMTPGQAADIVSVLPGEERRGILKLLEPAEVAKIEEIIEKQDTTILNFATANFLKCSPETTVEQARNKLRDTAKSTDVVMYFYIVDESGKLLGVVDIKEVFVAQDTERLKDLMVENVIGLNQDATMKQAADMFLR
jgi:Mg/Co/Ni transporter MgtE